MLSAWLLIEFIQIGTKKKANLIKTEVKQESPQAPPASPSPVSSTHHHALPYKKKTSEDDIDLVEQLELLQAVLGDQLDPLASLFTTQEPRIKEALKKVMHDCI